MFKKPISAVVTAALLCASFGFQNRAEALVIIDAVNNGTVGAALQEDTDAEARLFFVYPIGVTFLAGLGALGGPVGAVIGGVIGLLDNPSDSMSKLTNGLAQKYPTLSQNRDEAQNMAALIINSAALEKQQAQQVSLTHDQIAAVAPIFAGSPDYQRFLNDLKNSSN